jgi:hypothetical protein
MPFLNQMAFHSVKMGSLRGGWVSWRGRHDAVGVGIMVAARLLESRIMLAIPDGALHCLGRCGRNNLHRLCCQRQRIVRVPCCTCTSCTSLVPSCKAILQMSYMQPLAVVLLNFAAAEVEGDVRMQM